MKKNGAVISQIVVLSDPAIKKPFYLNNVVLKELCFQTKPKLSN
jgi:hypothetical protein